MHMYQPGFASLCGSIEMCLGRYLLQPIATTSMSPLCPLKRTWGGHSDTILGMNESLVAIAGFIHSYLVSL